MPLRVPSLPRFGAPALFVLLLLLQLPLICNSGYFSHDELQWWARADVATWTQLPWMSWTDLSVFQYRPLTFNLWLLFAHWLAPTPYWMHLAIVALGSANAILLARCVEGMGTTRGVATVATVAFVLSPYVAYTHGWTATLADLIVLGAGLLALRLLQGYPGAARDGDRWWYTTIAVVALVAAALLSKESAVVLPALLATALYRHPNRRSIALLIALSAIVVAVYLSLRLNVILGGVHVEGSYAWAPLNLPRRLLEYLLFPFMPPLFEIGPTLAKSASRLALATSCVVALLAALTTLGWRWSVAWMALYGALLAPVLILDVSYNQYAYLASAAAIGIAAVAWAKLERGARIAIVAVAVVAVLHAGTIMTRMREVGAVQRNFYDDLLPRLADASRPLEIAVADVSDRWMVERFTSGVTRYRGATIGGRVALVGDTPAQDSAPRLIMQPDGHLVVESRN